MATEAPDEETIPELLTRLADDARDYGRAEIEHYRALAEQKLDDARASLWMGALAAGLLIGAATALVVGLVLTLAPLVGPGGATLIVVSVTGGIAWLLGRMAWRHIKSIVGLGK